MLIEFLGDSAPCPPMVPFHEIFFLADDQKILRGKYLGALGTPTYANFEGGARSKNNFLLKTFIPKKPKNVVFGLFFENFSCVKRSSFCFERARKIKIADLRKSTKFLKHCPTFLQKSQIRAWLWAGEEL